jgi:outer membrane protein TolC
VGHDAVRRVSLVHRDGPGVRRQAGHQHARGPARRAERAAPPQRADRSTANRAAIGRIRATEAQLAHTDRQAEYTRDRILADVRDALSAMRAARERVGVTRREVALARELARAERQKFDLGDSTLIFVNLREQAAAEAAIREIDALADFQKAYASYLYATGTAR